MDSDPLANPVKKGEIYKVFVENQLLRGSNMLRGSIQKQIVSILLYCYLCLCFWIFIVTMGLIHCGFGVFLFLTHNL